LRRLRAGFPVAVPARELGVDAVVALSDRRVIQPGFPPDSGDSLVMEHEGEAVAFSVFKIGNGYLCREERDANPRTLEGLSADELRLCRLNRVEFYRVLAGDLAIDADPVEIARGIWRIGRRTMAGLGRTCVYLVEPGFREEHLERALIRETFKVVCFLGVGALPHAEVPSGIKLVTGIVEVRAGSFHSNIFEDLAASVDAPAAATYVDLESSPQRLVICGEEFPMLEHLGNPLVGLKYLEFLIDHPREPIAAWKLFLAANPGLNDGARAMLIADDSDGEEGRQDQDEVITGIRQTDDRPELQPDWEDDLADPKALKNVRDDLAKKREQLDRLLLQQPPERKIQELEQEISGLEDYLGAGRSSNIRARPIKHSGREKARDSVRNGLKTVIARVAKQNMARARELDLSISKGYDVMFTPPPDWGL
jgi:hypothetical protein